MGNRKTEKAYLSRKKLPSLFCWILLMQNEWKWCQNLLRPWMISCGFKQNFFKHQLIYHFRFCFILCHLINEWNLLLKSNINVNYVHINVNYLQVLSYFVQLGFSNEVDTFKYSSILIYFQALQTHNKR
jgi:hypothetical protein